MRRWFVAVFTLHFFVSVAAFSFGHIDTHVPGASIGTALDGHWPDRLSHPAQAKDLLGAAPDHGLTDSQPDLPDIIKPVALPVGSAPDQPAPPGPVGLRRVSPTLEGPQRPPRGLQVSV